MFEFDAILKGCGRAGKRVSESVWCKILNEKCNMPDDTPDCPVWVEWAETSRASDSKRKDIEAILEESKKDIHPARGQPITPDLYGKLYPDLSATDLAKSLEKNRKSDTKRMGE